AGQRGGRHEIREGDRLRPTLGRARGGGAGRRRAEDGGPPVKEDTMKTILWALAAAGTCLLAAAVVFGDQPAGKRADGAAMKAAESAAKSWLALMDSGQYARSWKEAAQQFRRQITKEEWEKSAKSARESLGKVLSRELKIEQYGQGMPGAPDAEYLVLVF